MNVNHSLENYLPITGKAKGSFARFTIEKRLPVIIDNIIAYNSFSGRIENKLLSLKQSVLSGKTDIAISSGSDKEEWNHYREPYKNFTFFEVPFFFAEAYFYSLILDISGYFSTGFDPFTKVKEKDVLENLSHFAHIISNLEKAKSEKDSKSYLQDLLQLSLWGNKSDLSRLSLDRNLNDANSEHNLVIDHSEEIEKILTGGISEASFILDNSGIELFTDLVAAKELIEGGFVNKINLHVKAFPTFVSDATETDLSFLLQTTTSNDEQTAQFSADIKCLIAQGNVKVISDPFWNTPLHFFQMPVSLMEKLQTSDLLIFKGDANYRRIFGDKVLPYTVNPKMLTSYLPVKSIALRILKSEIITGINEKALLQLDSSDKDWLINGKYGVIQFLN